MDIVIEVIFLIIVKATFVMTEGLYIYRIKLGSYTFHVKKTSLFWLGRDMNKFDVLKRHKAKS